MSWFQSNKSARKTEDRSGSLSEPFWAIHRANRFLHDISIVVVKLASLIHICFSISNEGQLHYSSDSDIMSRITPSRFMSLVKLDFTGQEITDEK